MSDRWELSGELSTAVLVTGLDKVTSAMHVWWLEALGEVIDEFGSNTKLMPVNQATGLTEGFVIVTFETKEAAKVAAETICKKWANAVQLDGHAHIVDLWFSCCRNYEQALKEVKEDYESRIDEAKSSTSAQQQKPGLKPVSRNDGTSMRVFNFV